MTELVAVIFPYGTTASAAAEDVRQLNRDLAPDPSGMATLIRDDRGDYWVTTSYAGDPHQPRAAFWFLLFNALMFAPASGVVHGLTQRALARRLAEAGIDRPFQRAIREELAPDTSALFLLLDEPPDDDALSMLRRFAGTVHTTAPRPRAEALLAQALYAVQPDDVRSADSDSAGSSGHRHTDDRQRWSR